MNRSKAAVNDDDDSSGRSPDENNMEFKVLMKKGKQQFIKSLNIPMASRLAFNTATQQNSEKAEQQQLKEKILQYEEEQEEALLEEGIHLEYSFLF
jgi:mannose/fructose-specific phosphotransferase system component IIA